MPVAYASVNGTVRKPWIGKFKIEFRTGITRPLTGLGERYMTLMFHELRMLGMDVATDHLVNEAYFELMIEIASYPPYGIAVQNQFELYPPDLLAKSISKAICNRR